MSISVPGTMRILAVPLCAAIFAVSLLLPTRADPPISPIAVLEKQQITISLQKQGV